MYFITLYLQDPCLFALAVTNYGINILSYQQTRLRLVNPEKTKYLQSVRSVDNIEWICQTCNNHLKKGRVPPCAIVNGMQFPEKPFFYLNELECRLIAPRLAFQKIFQAPRGGQLKITGNVVNVPADVPASQIIR